MYTRFIIYLKRHWRGEFSLPVSFWVNGVLASALSNLFIMLAIELAPEAQTYIEKLLRLALILVIEPAILVWPAVGIWRSASRHEKSGSDDWWGPLSVVAFGAFSASVLYWWVKGFILAIELLRLATGEAKYTEYLIHYTEKGELIAYGYITMELVAEAKEILDQHPEAKLIQLDLKGGRIRPARELRDLVAERNLATYSERGCFSACTHVFLAGRIRILGVNAQLGFHGWSVTGFTTEELRDLEKPDREYMSSKRVSPFFISKAFEPAGKDFWLPTLKKLAAEGYVTHIYLDSKKKLFVVSDYCATNDCG